VVGGPAIIEEFGSTVPVHPGFTATVDRHGNLRISRSSSPDLRDPPGTSHEVGLRDQGGSR
jgi:hypothetical protein